MKKQKHKRTPSSIRAQIERVIFRTMKIEDSRMTRSIAKKAAAKVRIAK